MLGFAIMMCSLVLQMFDLSPVFDDGVTFSFLGASLGEERH